MGKDAEESNSEPVLKDAKETKDQKVSKITQNEEDTKSNVQAEEKSKEDLSVKINGSKSVMITEQLPEKSDEKQDVEPIRSEENVRECVPEKEEVTKTTNA